MHFNKRLKGVEVVVSRFRWVAALGSCGLFLSQEGAAEPRQYEIDPAHFSIAFQAHHIGFADTIGMFLDGRGSFVFDETVPEVSDVLIEIEAPSVFTNHDERDGHLRSGDFLDAENHPIITFVGKEATPTGERTGTITGDLTFRGVTREETFDLVLNKTGEYPFGSGPEGGPPYVVGVSVTGTINRSDYGSIYAVENDWVGDEVDLTVELEAIRQPK